MVNAKDYLDDLYNTYYTLKEIPLQPEIIVSEKDKCGPPGGIPEVRRQTHISFAYVLTLRAG